MHSPGLIAQLSAQQCATNPPPALSPAAVRAVLADEGRVQSSAAAFTKGLLDLEGAALTPILVR
jgi:hypothetical protein